MEDIKLLKLYKKLVKELNLSVKTEEVYQYNEHLYTEEELYCNFGNTPLYALQETIDLFKLIQELENENEE